MALSKNQLFLLKEVFTKVKYDKTLEKFIIHVDDYLPLDLTKDQLRLLEKMCYENSIELEKLPNRISYAEGEELLLEYKQLKEKIKNTKDKEEQNKLTKDLIEIRNKIVLGYMELIYKIINKSYPMTDEQYEREDLYQIGYVVLIEFIDKYEPSKNLTFSNYLRMYSYYKIFDELLATDKGLKKHTAKNLEIIKKLKEDLKEKATINKLMEITGFSREKVKFLLSLEKATEDIGLEDFLDTNVLSDVDIEEELIEKTIKENLLKLLEFLNEKEREVIKLYYGFYDDVEYSLDAIAKKMGYGTSERIRQIRNDALFKLKLPIYNIHISNIESSELMLEDFLNMKRECFIKKRIKEYEVSLLSSLSKEKLESLINDLPIEIQEVLSLYLGIEGKKYNIFQISKKLNISERRTKAIVEEGLFMIKTRINKSTNKGYSQSSYYNYLSQLYFKKKTKR